MTLYYLTKKTPYLASIALISLFSVNCITSPNFSEENEEDHSQRSVFISEDEDKCALIESSVICPNGYSLDNAPSDKNCRVITSALGPAIQCGDETFYPEGELTCHFLPNPVNPSEYFLHTPMGNFGFFNYSCPDEDLKCWRENDALYFQCKGHEKEYVHECTVQNFFESPEYQPVKRKPVKGVNYDNPKENTITISTNELDKAFARWLEKYHCNFLIGNVTYLSEDPPKDSKESKRIKELQSDLKNKGIEPLPRTNYLDSNKDGILTNVTEFNSLKKIYAISGKLKLKGITVSTLSLPNLLYVQSLEFLSSYVKWFDFPNLLIPGSITISNLPNVTFVKLNFRYARSVQLTGLDNLLRINDFWPNSFGIYWEQFYYPFLNIRELVILDCPEFPFYTAYSMYIQAHRTTKKPDKFICKLGNLKHPVCAWEYWDLDTESCI